MSARVRALAPLCAVAFAGAALFAACGRYGMMGSKPPLKYVYEKAFLMGAAVNEAQVIGDDARGAALVKTHFNTITPENILKWERVHPLPHTYEFVAPDGYVQFGEANKMFIVGHTLVWHNQTPRWVFEDSAGRPVSRDTLLARLHDHIATVVGRYKGRIKGWDVVNEALDDQGNLRDSPWRRIIGDDYIAIAFRWAHEADPDAELYYNDYSLEDAGKRIGAVRLIQTLRAQGVPITGIGMQEHNKLDWPTTAQIDTAIDAFAATGVRVVVTELDVDVLPRIPRIAGAEVTERAAAPPGSNPYPGALPDSVQERLAERYAELFKTYWRHRDVIDRVTFWGVHDASSWLNNWPVRGRTNHPMLWDRQLRPKPALDAVIGALRP